MTPNAADARHDELRELLGVYALDALLPDERAALRAHLAGCAECRAALADLRRVVANLPLLLDEVEPPPTLRRRLEADLQADLAARGLAEQPIGRWGPAVVSTPGFDSSATPRMSPLRPLPMPEPIQPPSRTPAPTPITTAPSRRVVVPWAVAAALLLAVSLGMLIWNLRLQEEAARPESGVVASSGRGGLGRTTSREAALFGGAVVALVPGDVAPEAGGELLIDRKDDLLVLDVHDLPPLAPGQVYQVWLIGEGDPVPFGVFGQETDRHAIAADPEAYQTLAITNEPGPLGLPAPTGQIVASAPLGG